MRSAASIRYSLLSYIFCSRGCGTIQLAAHLVWPLRHGVVGGLGHEAQSALTADHEALHDLDGLVCGEVHQRVQSVARGALDGELAPDECGQAGVALHALCQRRDAFKQLAVALYTAAAASAKRPDNSSQFQLKQHLQVQHSAWRLLQVIPPDEIEIGGGGGGGGGSGYTR